MKIVVVSGFFNPLHGGHLDMIEAAKQMGDRLIVLVDNDKQQVIKKGKIILPEENRLRLIRALRAVDEAYISLGDESGQVKSLQMLIEKYPSDYFIFANGGDRKGEGDIIEADFCRQHNIEMAFGVGGTEKADSSTRINQALGHQK
jgi:cytidyltransferase-like protein